MSVRWQHYIDHADKQTKAGRLTRLSSLRSFAADRQSVKRDDCASLHIDDFTFIAHAQKRHPDSL